MFKSSCSSERPIDHLGGVGVVSSICLVKLIIVLYELVVVSRIECGQGIGSSASSEIFPEGSVFVCL
jgi:hypothetical protein